MLSKSKIDFAIDSAIESSFDQEVKNLRIALHRKFQRKIMALTYSSTARRFAFALTLATSFANFNLAHAEVNAATLVLAKAAVTNLKIIELISGATVSGVTDDKTLTQAVKDKMKKYIIEGIKKAAPGIIVRIANVEAAKYDLKQLSDIVEVSALPYMQKTVLATASQQPGPAESEITASENAVMKRVGDHDYVINFIKEIMKMGGNDKEVVAIVTSAVKRSIQ